MRDSLNKIHQGHAEHEGGEEGLTKYLSKVTGDDVSNGQTERGFMNAANGVTEKQF